MKTNLVEKNVLKIHNLKCKLIESTLSEKLMNFVFFVIMMGDLGLTTWLLNRGWNGWSVVWMVIIAISVGWSDRIRCCEL